VQGPESSSTVPIIGFEHLASEFFREETRVETAILKFEENNNRRVVEEKCTNEGLVVRFQKEW
jgi:hypothetical protein